MAASREILKVLVSLRSAAARSLNTQHQLGKSQKDQEDGFRSSVQDFATAGRMGVLSALLTSQSCLAVMLVMATCLALAQESEASCVTNKMWGAGFSTP